MSRGCLYGPRDFYKTQRILITVQYSGKGIDLKETAVPADVHVPKNCTPIYVEGTLTLFETNAIAEYLGNDDLQGKSNRELVSQWCNFSDLKLLPAIGTLVFPCFGIMQFIKAENDKAKKVVDDQLHYINNYLSTRTYLVGERITQADITLFSVMKMLYEKIYDAAARKPLLNLNRWITTIANQHEVKSVVGDFNLCEVPAQFDAKTYAKLNPKNSDKKVEKVEKKTEKKVTQKEKPKKVEEKPDKEDEEPSVPVEKEVDPYKALPSGSFNMEEWKRVYSNNDIITVALPYFWQNLDTENYSIWTCEYLFPEELGLIFMTCNLVSGMFQRLEKMRKYAFGSMVVLGQDKDNIIKGLWVWRGQDLAFTLSPDCSIDYESYSWKKLDPRAEETKEVVQRFFTHEGDFGEKKFNQGKIFK